MSDTKSPMTFIPLILGGHSFIAQLGNDPKPTSVQADALVAACLDQGIHHFDTTYRPERIALGDSLNRLGRRNEARLIAWNFFQDFDDNGPVGSVEPLRDEHLDSMLRDLQTDTLEELVVHSVPDEMQQQQQEKLALRWRDEGRVGRLGLWSPGEKVEFLESRAAYSFVVEPCNVFTPQAENRIALYHRLGLEVYACSPFVRGWQLEKLAASAVQRGAEEIEVQARLADHLLRYALFMPHVTHLIVAMRRAEWVAVNIESVQRGRLSSSEYEWLQESLR